MSRLFPALVLMSAAAAWSGCAQSHPYAHDGDASVVDASGPHDQGVTDDSIIDVGSPDAGMLDDMGTVRDAGPPPTVPLVAGDGVLIDAFVTTAGIVVVLRDQVLLVSRAGGELARWTAPREITSAAFDGTYLGIADGAALTTLTASLEEQGDVFLTEPCASSVIVGQHRFVCGPSNDWDRVFYTYDLVTSMFVASSEPYTYNGIPMRAVPGRDAFITVNTRSSPADVHYYAVESSGVPTFINDSPYHGDFAVNGVYAFDSATATHVVTHEGVLLRIDPCTEAHVYPSTCFVRDGAVGTLRSGEEYLALDTGADGNLYALVGRGARWGVDSVCDDGCTGQRIDVSTRTVTASAGWNVVAAQLVTVRHDSVTGGMIAAGHRECDVFEGECVGWRVFHLAFE